MDRAEHIRWAKARALKYLDAGNPQEAVTSMLSDLSKHEETKGIGEKMAMFGIWHLMQKPYDLRQIRRFIEGFAE